MGRREDGAVVRDGLEIRLRTHRVGEPGNPAVGRCGAAELEQRTPTPRAMAGLRSRAIGPGARSWLTGAWLVHAPESAARHHEIRRMWSAGRRVPPIARRNGVIVRPPPGWSRRPSIGGFAHPRVCRRSAPLDGGEELDFGLRRTRRRSKNTGGGALACPPKRAARTRAV